MGQAPSARLRPQPEVLRGTLDIDRFPIEVHGRQAGGAYHGYCRQTMYHPLVASLCAEGDYVSSRLGEGFIHAILRRANAPAGAAAPRRAHRRGPGRRTGPRRRGRRGCGFVGRIKANDRLEALAAPYLRPDPGRPTKDGDEFALDLGDYRAASWTRSYWLLLVVVDLPDPKTGLRALFPHSFSLVTNWGRDQRTPWALVEHYRQRGTFEDRLGEFNAAIGGGLPAGPLEANETGLLLKLLAFNLAGMVRGELEDSSANGWDPKPLQQTGLRAGARVVKHGGRLIVDVARAAGVVWARFLARVKRWCRDPGPGVPRSATRPLDGSARSRPSVPCSARVTHTQPGPAPPQLGLG